MKICKISNFWYFLRFSNMAYRKKYFLRFLFLKCLVLIRESALQYFGHRYLRFQTFSFSWYSQIIRDTLIISMFFLFKCSAKMLRHTRQTQCSSFYHLDACSWFFSFGRNMDKLTDLVNFPSFAAPCISARSFFIVGYPWRLLI